MSKKTELIEQAKKLGLNLTVKNTISEIEQAIANASLPVVEMPAELPVVVEEAPTEES